MMRTPYRIFVGSDRSQRLAFRALEFSIRRHTAADVEITAMDNLNLPEPEDPREGSRTGFSFTRFAIPKLAGYRGGAIYLDADMQVFHDIAELAEIPYDGASVVIQDDLPEEHQPKPGKVGAPSRRIKQSSVMLLDCERLDWVPEDIILALGKEYSYEDLLYHFCILDENQVRYAVPFEWNSLETYRPGQTRLIHFTDMYTQPWVTPANPNGWIWVEEVRRMLRDGAATLGEIEEDVRLGYIRPSLIDELATNGEPGPPSAERISALEGIDAVAKFVKHPTVYERKRERKRLIAEYGRRHGG